MYYLVRTPSGRFCKVHEDDLKEVPYKWHVYKNLGDRDVFRPDGVLNKRYHGVKRIRTRQDFIDFDRKRIKSVELLFGYFDNL